MASFSRTDLDKGGCDSATSTARIYVCTTCGKRYQRNAHLRRHEATRKSIKFCSISLLHYRAVFLALRTLLSHLPCSIPLNHSHLPPSSFSAQVYSLDHDALCGTSTLIPCSNLSQYCLTRLRLGQVPLPVLRQGVWTRVSSQSSSCHLLPTRLFNQINFSQRRVPKAHAQLHRKGRRQRGSRASPWTQTKGMRGLLR